MSDPHRIARLRIDLLDTDPAEVAVPAITAKLGRLARRRAPARAAVVTASTDVH